MKLGEGMLRRVLEKWEVDMIKMHWIHVWQGQRIKNILQKKS